MNESLDADETRIVAERAAAWQIALESDDPKQLAAFWTWVRKSPTHVREALLSGQLQEMLRLADPQQRIDIDALLDSEPGNVVALNAPQVPPTAPARFQPRRIFWAIAAVVVLATAGIAIWQATARLSPNVRSYVTETGELRTITLEDGSTVFLDAQSRLKVRFTSSGRDIDLDGQALFKVTHDTVRRFRVHTGDAMVEAVGTEFNVRADKVTTISVLDGVVRVFSTENGQQADATPVVPHVTRLAAGEATTVAKNGAIKDSTKIDRAAVTAWQQHRLVFSSTPLSQIVREFSRYTAKPIRIEGDALGDRPFGGVFDASDPSPLLDFVVSSDPSIEIEQRENEVVIRERATPAHP